MNAKLPLVLTSASVAALLGATAHAQVVGNVMDYSQAIIVTSLDPTTTVLNGSGSGTGSGVFDAGGTLDVVSEVETKLAGGMFTGTVFATTVYQGSIGGNTWTYSGTSTTTFTGCTGSPVICGNITTGPAAPSTGNATFTLDILTGGTWMTSSTTAGLVRLDVDHELIAVLPPAPPPVATSIPTMSAYGLGFTAIALFGAAAGSLRTSRKRK